MTHALTHGVYHNIAAFAGVFNAPQARGRDSHSPVRDTGCGRFRIEGSGIACGVV